MKQLKKYSDKQFRILLEQLGIYELTAKQEILHHIRVQLKKIKSLFYLINYCLKKFNASKEYNPLKEIFTEAGKIREIDVANKLFLEYHIKLNNGEFKTNAQQKLIFDFRQNVSRYKKIVSKNQKNIDKHFENVNSDCFKKYINIKKGVLLDQIYPVLIESKLHKSRKIIKEIIYLSGISQWRKKNMTPFYDEIQNVIGRWHDKKELLKIEGEHNFNFSKRIIKKLESQCLNDLKILKQMITNFYNQRNGKEIIIYKNTN